MGGEPVNEFAAFLAVAIPSLVWLGVTCVLFTCFRAQRPSYYAAAQPNSRVGQAVSPWRWAFELSRVKNVEILENTGMDGLLHVLRAEMVVAILGFCVTTSVPLLFAYSFPQARHEATVVVRGFSQFSLSNVAPENAPQLWLTVVCMWLNALFAFWTLDLYDGHAARCIAESLEAATLEDYAVVVHDLPLEEVPLVRAFFESIYGVQSVVAVLDVPQLSKSGKSASLRGACDRLKKGPLSLQGDDQSPRGTLQACIAALEVAPRQCEAALEQARVAQALTSPPSRAVIVVFDELSKASSSIFAPLTVWGFGCEPDTWAVSPAPEPSDVLWELLERFPTVAERSARKEHGNAAKTALFVYYFVIVGVLTSTAVMMVPMCSRIPGLGTWMAGDGKVFVTLISALIPTYLSSWALGHMAVVLADIAKQTEGVFSNSAVQLAVQRDYSNFLILDYFLATLVSGMLASSILEIVKSPLSAPRVVTASVPAQGYLFCGFALWRLARDSFKFARIYDYIHARSKVMRTRAVRLRENAGSKMSFKNDKNAGSSKMSLTKGSDPVSPSSSSDPDSSMMTAPFLSAAVPSAWANLFTVVGVCYATIAPVTTFFCFIWLIANRWWVTMYASVLAKPKHDTKGAFWVLSMRILSRGLQLAVVLQSLTVFFFSAVGVSLSTPKTVGELSRLVRALLILGLPLVTRRIKLRLVRRWDSAVHGKCRGRLALRDAVRKDRQRDRAEVVEAQERLIASHHWEAPSSKPPLHLFDPVDGSDAAAVERRLVGLRAWLARHKRRGDRFEAQPSIEHLNEINSLRNFFRKKQREHSTAPPAPPCSLNHQSLDDESNTLRQRHITPADLEAPAATAGPAVCHGASIELLAIEEE